MATSEPEKTLYRIGVDVGKYSHILDWNTGLTLCQGGTNTDAALVCWDGPVDSNGNNREASHGVRVVASNKSQTTPDVTTGIQNAIRAVISTAVVPHDAVISVNIGTTHFINAVVQ